MAKFNVDQQENQAPNFMNYSQTRRGNQAWGTLFEGIGDIAVGGAKIADTNIKNNLYQEAEGAVDQVRNLFGADDGTAVGTARIIPEGPSAVPQEISQSKNYLERLSKGYQNGTVKSSYYYGNLQSVVKSLKAKYPGYEKDVDETIQSITGVTPANAIISSLRQEAEEEGQIARADANRFDTFINSHIDSVTATMPDYFQNPGKYSETQVKQNVGSYEAYAANQRRQSADLALRASQNELTETDVRQAAANGVTILSNQLISGGLNTLGADYQGINAKINEWAKSGRTPSADELQEIKIALSQLRLGYTQQAEAYLRKDFDPANPSLGNMYSYLGKDQKKLDDIIAIGMRPIEALENAITNGDYGYVSMAAAYNKATLDTDVNTILRDPNAEILRRAQAVNSIAGQEGTNIFYQDEKNQVDANKAIRDVKLPPAGKILLQDNQNKVTLGEAGDVTQDIVTAGAQASASSKIGKNLPNEILNAHIANITGGSGAAVENSANYLFASGPDGEGLNINKIQPNQKVSTFARFATPAVAKSIKKAAADGNPEVWENYKNWVSQSYVATARFVANDIKNVEQTVGATLDVSFDPTTGKIIVTDNMASFRNQQIRSGNTGGIDDTSMRMAREQLLEQYRQLNVLTTGVRAVAQEDGEGNAMGESLQRQFDMLGITIKPLTGRSPDERGEPQQKNLLDERQQRELLTDPISRRESSLDGENRVRQTQSNTRNRPIASDLENVLNLAASSVGDVNVQVYSGGQAGRGERGKRTGSHRHDHGNAADVYLRDANGRTIDWRNEEDRPKVIQFIQEAVANGATGIGAGPGYMGAGLHIGYGPNGERDGEVMTWGAGGRSKNAPKWLRDAVAQATRTTQTASAE